MEGEKKIHLPQETDFNQFASTYDYSSDKSVAEENEFLLNKLCKA